MNRISIAFVLFTSIVLYLVPASASSHSSAYYDIVNYISEGKNLYNILEVTEDSSIAETRKSFRRLSMKYHPDKDPENRTPEGYARYVDIMFAYEVLMDDDKRRDYENLLRYGVPRTHAFYGKYAYRYGAPNIDAEYIVLGLVLFISGFQYFYKYYRHVLITQKAKDTLRYKTKVAQALREGRELPEIVIRGAEKPNIQDVFIVQLILLPYTLCTALWKRWKGEEIKEEDEMNERDEQLMREKGWTREELEQYKEEMTDKFRTSSRAKQYRRFMRKR